MKDELNSPALVSIRQRLDRLEERFGNLKKQIDNPPKFKNGDHIVYKTTDGVLLAFVKGSPYYCGGWRYALVDESGESIPPYEWDEGNMTLVDDIKSLLCKEE